VEEGKRKRFGERGREIKRHMQKMVGKKEGEGKKSVLQQDRSRESERERGCAHTFSSQIWDVLLWPGEGGTWARLRSLMSFTFHVALSGKPLDNRVSNPFNKYL